MSWLTRSAVAPTPPTNVRFRIFLSGISQYDFTSTINLINTFKVEINGTSISLYYWNTSVWTKIGTTQTVDFSGITLTPKLGGVIGVSASASDQAKMDNYYQTNDTYTTNPPT